MWNSYGGQNILWPLLHIFRVTQPLHFIDKLIYWQLQNLEKTVLSVTKDLLVTLDFIAIISGPEIILLIFQFENTPYSIILQLFLSQTSYMNTKLIFQVEPSRAGFTQLELPRCNELVEDSRHTGSCIAWPLIAMANHLSFMHMSWFRQGSASCANLMCFHDSR